MVVGVLQGVTLHFGKYSGQVEADTLATHSVSNSISLQKQAMDWIIVTIQGVVVIDTIISIYKDVQTHARSMGQRTYFRVVAIETVVVT